MTIRLILAIVHLLALGVGLGAVYARARALRKPLDRDGVRRVLAADSWWGLAGFLWISTGLARLFMGTEKATAYYFHNHLFIGKMGFLVLLLVLEVIAVIALMKWRKSASSGTAPDTSHARRLAAISDVQLLLVLIMVALAAAMARGLGATAAG
jgi:putative membrane protein